MDSRIIQHLENITGISASNFPSEGIRVCVSKARADEPKNRLRAHRISGNNGIAITAIPRLVDAVRDFAGTITGWELFSNFGLAELKRALPPKDAEYLEDVFSFDYFLTDIKDFHPVKPQHKVVQLKKKDIPARDEKLRLGERRSTEKGDFTWAFACYHDDPTIPVKVLPEYGPRCASVAVIFWRNDDIAGFGVATEEALRGQGYALDVVSTGTYWILDQGAVASYGVFSSNIPSVRIARRLGYSLAFTSFSA